MTYQSGKMERVLGWEVEGMRSGFDNANAS
jgi:hypothetical protein